MRPHPFSRRCATQRLEPMATRELCADARKLGEEVLAECAKPLASRREQHASPAALDQFGLHRSLERAHLVRHCRLRTAESVGGSREAACGADRVEDVEVRKLGRALLQ